MLYFIIYKRSVTVELLRIVLHFINYFRLFQFFVRFLLSVASRYRLRELKGQNQPAGTFFPLLFTNMINSILLEFISIDKAITIVRHICRCSV